MRIVVFDVSGVLEAFDYRGVLIHKQEIQAEQKVELPFTQKNLFKFNGVFFAVCEGVGNLDYRDYPKNLNFSRLNIRSLNDYLLFKKEPQDKKQQELVKEFLEIYDKNIEKGFYYLEPPFFKEKESELLNMRFETNDRS
ncbi:hypothetical protein [Helicobacter pylori]|uniref:hypothetical protein n=1 Tax=Helicobacter pylori TaxID=210 RepID=UPI0015E76CB4|nr:hypothetical protein [Helicobacter pylori]